MASNRENKKIAIVMAEALLGQQFVTVKIFDGFGARIKTNHRYPRFICLIKLSNVLPSSPLVSKITSDSYCFHLNKSNSVFNVIAPSP